MPGLSKRFSFHVDLAQHPNRIGVGTDACTFWLPHAEANYLFKCFFECANYVQKRGTAAGVEDFPISVLLRQFPGVDRVGDDNEIVVSAATVIDALPRIIKAHELLSMRSWEAMGETDTILRQIAVEVMAEQGGGRLTATHIFRGILTAIVEFDARTVDLPEGLDFGRFRSELVVVESILKSADINPARLLGETTKIEGPPFKLTPRLVIMFEEDAQLVFSRAKSLAGSAPTQVIHFFSALVERAESSAGEAWAVIALPAIATAAKQAVGPSSNPVAPTNETAARETPPQPKSFLQKLFAFKK